ncbi:AsnC family protein [Streptomyces sp. NPDC097727]|uniref:AsnC family protein n=1 Tax=Streptomyces sp. NPDC097727 TaxID=3366092 RepID=UPI00381758A2
MPDDLDRKIIHGLNCSPQVSFRHLSEVVGVSEQTVARRYSACAAPAWSASSG